MHFIPRSGFVLTWLVLSAMAELHAQSLDTAPGANSASAITPLTPVPGSTMVAPLPAGTALVTNGDFSSATKDPQWPNDWDKSSSGAVTWQLDNNGKHFFRLVSQQAEQHVQLYRVIDIPPGVKAVEFSVKYRVSNLKKGKFDEDDARTILEFLDLSKKPIAAAPPVVFDKSTPDWTTVTERFPVPPLALHLAIMPCLYRVDAGTLDLAEIQVKNLGEAESQEAISQAASVAAKKLAGENAILDHDLALPPKSPELHVARNQIVTAEGRLVLLQGVNVGNLSIRPDEEHKILWSVHVALDEWKANVIRLPVLDSFWFGKGRGSSTQNDQEAYRAIADKVIKIAAGKGAYVVFDLHRYVTPDASCVTFWQDAAARYKNNPAVLFDILNEPHGTTWKVWRDGGLVNLGGKDPHTIQSVGMQTLVDTVRATGAKNIIVAGGLEYAFDLTGILNGYALDEKGGNGIMYATHFYNWHGGWAKHFLGVSAKYPVLVGECGADITKMNFVPANKQEDPYTWVPDAIGFIQKNHLNWTAWCFHTRATPDLLLDWDYDTPTPFWGAFVKDALAGKVYEMKRER